MLRNPSYDGDGIVVGTHYPSVCWHPTDHAHPVRCFVDWLPACGVATCVWPLGNLDHSDLPEGTWSSHYSHLYQLVHWAPLLFCRMDRGGTESHGYGRQPGHITFHLLWISVGLRQYGAGYRGWFRSVVCSGGPRRQGVGFDGNSRAQHWNKQSSAGGDIDEDHPYDSGTVDRGRPLFVWKQKDRK